MATELHIQKTTGRGESQSIPMRSLIRDGVSGNFDVIYQMIRLIRATAQNDYGFKQFVNNLLELNNLDSNSSAEDILRLLFNFVAKNDSVIIGRNKEGASVYNKRIRYILDAAGRIESIKDARQTLADRFGDCDDHAILTASLAGALGFEDVKLAIAKYIPNAQSFQHIYTTVYKDGKRYVLDTTLRDADFNKEAKAAEVKEIPVFSDVVGLDGLSGVINNSIYHAKQFGRAITKTIPTAVNFLPLGFADSTAFATGAELLNTSNYKELSFNATVSRINNKLRDIIESLCKSEISLDLARSLALQASVQINAVSQMPADKEAVQVMKDSIKYKLQFINNFESYARAHNIRVVYLNSNMMFLAGLAGISYAGFQLYKAFR